MLVAQLPHVKVETFTLHSTHLNREVQVDLYMPRFGLNLASMVIFNDGQDLVTMHFEEILEGLYDRLQLQPLVCVGVHCGPERIQEYGMTVGPDFKGRGAKAGEYQHFLLEELLPEIYRHYLEGITVKETAIGGFSLGGLNALDLAWNNPDLFKKVGVFSGSLWWRSKDKTDREFNENSSRMMHQQIRNSSKKQGLRFFFECGELDEKDDRNNNGVIDSIDDTIDLLRELLKKGYLEGPDFSYLQLPDGKHDVPTWARSLPYFLRWGWGR